jgi:hypothetical protein
MRSASAVIWMALTTARRSLRGASSTGFARDEARPAEPSIYYHFSRISPDSGLLSCFPGLLHRLCVTKRWRAARDQSPGGGAVPGARTVHGAPDRCNDTGGP